MAHYFGKRHDNLLQTIKNLGCSDEFRHLNFKESYYKNEQNKKQPMYLMTQDGFTLLAIAFEKSSKGLLAMIYRFKAISRFDLRRTSQPISSFPRYIVKINADTLDQAKAKVSPFFVVLEVNND